MSLGRKGAEAGGSNEEKQTKNNPCYFCNEIFELGQLQLHLKQCGSILEQCPLRCGAWIQRKHKETHVAECPRLDKRSTSSPTHASPADPASSMPPRANHTWSPRAVPLDDCVTFLEKEVATIKLVLTEEAHQRELQTSELETLRVKLTLLDEQCRHLVSSLSSLRGSADDAADRADNCTARLTHDLANVQLALQELQSQQLSTASRLESAVSTLLHEQNERELLGAALAHHDHRIRSVNKLEEVIEYIKQTLHEERKRNSESRAALEAELHEARRSSEQLSQLTTLRAQLQGAADPLALDRLAVLEVATADARAEAEALSTRVESMSRDLRALTKSYLKMRSELADFQARVTLDRPELGSDDGRLIWRIDNFTARMKDAKENDTILSSPIFRTGKYGYTLKAELNLNGIGKWKGRHMTSTVRLVSGPYDALLRWPCSLSISIVLRDQPSDRHQAMDIMKSLELRRKSSSKRHDYDDGGTASTTRSNEALDKSVLQLKRQYIFIPHTSLDKFDYVKNDVMFLEFVVEQ